MSFLTSCVNFIGFCCCFVVTQCAHRYVFCPNEGCSKKTVKAHRLEHHLRFDCDSQIVTKR